MLGQGNAIVGGAASKDVTAVGYLVAAIRSGDAEGYTGAFCTGTLIARDVVLTAAHCLDGVEQQMTEAGVTFDHFAFGIGDPDGSKLFKARSAKLSARYESPATRGHASPTSRHDIAFLVLEEPVTGVEPASVRRSEHEPSCKYRAIGYGRTLDPRDRASWMQQDPGGRKSLDQVCVEEGFASDGTLPTRSEQGSACNGDSGGPLLVGRSTTLVGVASYGGDCKAGVPVHYAPVTANLAFVDEALRASRVDEGQATPP